MDDRIYTAKIGSPIPEWDRAHRLRISEWAGPECKDSATTFRINSTFMEITEQSHMIKQWLACGVLIAVCMMLGMSFLLVALLKICAEKDWPIGGMLSTIVPAFGVVAFGVMAYRWGKKEFFARKYYPIRLNRKTRKIYAIIRNDSMRSATNGGDCFEEIEWSDSSFFCIHRAEQDGVHYWIRYYGVDADGNVQQAIAIGRDWEGDDGLEELISQWNYWCWYMERGPDDLPRPCLFLPQNETLLESFLYCMYEIDFQAGLRFRILAMPVFLILAFCRIISVYTCRFPKWPPAVIEHCGVEPDDPFDEPRDCTPIGWYATARAISEGTYPAKDRRKINDWVGEANAKENARLWAKDKVISDECPGRDISVIEKGIV